MECGTFFAEVAVEGLAYYFDTPYSYIIPWELEEKALVGCRVTVPFGKGNRKKQGLILSVKPLIEAQNSTKLKSISSVVDKSPLFNDEMLSLVFWLKENTFCTLFEAAKAMLPAGIGLNYVVSYMANNVSADVILKLNNDELCVYNYLKDGCKFVKREKLLSDLQLDADSKIPEKLVKKGVLLTNVETKRKTGDMTVKNIRLAVNEADAEEICNTLTPKQKSVVRLLLDIGSASVKEVCYFTGVTSAVVKTVVKKGVAELFDSEIYRRPKQAQTQINAQSPHLTDSQNKAFLKLYEKYKSNAPAAALLFGVTGSGKTQVFLKLIEEVVKDGKGVIVMVPEIALTPQTLGIFYSHFGNAVAVFHSALSAGERLDEWKRVKNGEAKIAIGTRSAVFAPFEDLGLIVIDEEQEHTYKSEMTPRYHARDVAKFRCMKNNALLLLSSATPSLETYKNAIDGKYEYIKLSERYGTAVLPEVVTVDITDTQGALSNELYNALQTCLEDKKQAILLMNRRGFNTFASCSACKTVLTCPNCSISLTYHSANNRLMCHYCGYSQTVTAVCPECGEKSLRYGGYGTQRIEEELSSVFPNVKVLRMDADTTMARYSYQEKLSAFANGEYDILLGTQMVAKGLDFPRVTLVGIISVDHQLYNDDFRSSEKTFDLLTQVIGRSGRGAYKGKAYIQTTVPDNDIIEYAAAQDYESFYKTEDVIRRTMVYPPYCDICVLTFTSETGNKSLTGAKTFFEMIKNAVTSDFGDVKINLLGPIQPRVSKINNKYRYNLTVKCKNNRRFRAMMSEVLVNYMKTHGSGGANVTVDINPLS